MKKTILVFSEAISHGHMVRPLIVADWLKDHNIIFASNVDFFQGYDTVPIKSVNSSLVYGRIMESKPWYSVDELMEYFKEDKKVIATYNPDLIISDFRITALQLAHKLDIPSISITSAATHMRCPTLKTLPDMLLKDHDSYRGMDLLALRKYYNFEMEKIAQPMHEASTKFGISPKIHLFEYFCQGNLCLLSDDSNFVSIKPRDNDIFMGAVEYDDKSELPSIPEENLVYISLGTQNCMDTTYLKEYILKLLKTHSVVLSTGNKTLELNIDDNKFMQFEFVNQLKILKKAKVFVHHGGCLSTYQGLIAGVPMIALPLTWENHIYAEAILMNQSGSFMCPSKISIDKLIDLTHKLSRRKIGCNLVNSRTNVVSKIEELL